MPYRPSLGVADAVEIIVCDVDRAGSLKVRAVVGPAESCAFNRATVLEILAQFEHVRRHRDEAERVGGAGLV